jgi:hypothetical protein
MCSVAKLVFFTNSALMHERVVHSFYLHHQFLGYTASSGRMSDELERIWKEAVMA